MTFPQIQKNITNLLTRFLCCIRCTVVETTHYIPGVNGDCPTRNPERETLFTPSELPDALGTVRDSANPIFNKRNDSGAVRQRPNFSIYLTPMGRRGEE